MTKNVASFLACSVILFSVASQASAQTVTINPVFGAGFDADFNLIPDFDPTVNSGTASIVQVDFELVYEPGPGGEAFGGVVFTPTFDGVAPAASFGTYTAIDVLGIDPPGPPPAPALFATNQDLGEADLVDIGLTIPSGVTDASNPVLQLGQNGGFSATGPNGGTLFGQIFVDFDGVDAASVGIDITEVALNLDGGVPTVVANDSLNLVGGTLTIGEVAGGGDPILGATPVADPIDLSSLFLADAGDTLADAVALANIGDGDFAALGDITVEVVEESTPGLFSAALNGESVDVSLDRALAISLPGGDQTGTLSIGSQFGEFRFGITAGVPEPATFGLAGLAIVGLAGLRRRV